MKPSRLVNQVFWGILLFLFAIAIFPKGKEETLESVVTPQLCTEGPPEAIHERVYNEHPMLRTEIGCEACVDGFYELYARKLQGVNNKKYPAIAAYRKQLQSIIQHILDINYTIQPAGSGPGHSSNRMPAEVEYAIYSAGELNYGGIRGDKGFDLQDFEKLLMMQIRVHYEQYENMPSEITMETKIVSPMIDNLIKDFVELEKGMTTKQKAYFRSFAMRYVFDWLK
jgi:hypothetical protein